VGGGAHIGYSQASKRIVSTAANSPPPAATGGALLLALNPDSVRPGALTNGQAEVCEDCAGRERAASGVVVSTSESCDESVGTLACGCK